MFRSTPDKMRHSRKRVAAAVLLATLVATTAVMVLPMLHAARPGGSASPGAVGDSADSG